MTATATNTPTFFVNLGRMRTDAPILFVGGLISAALVVVFSLPILFEDRQLDGVNVWVKPTKFAYALSIYLLTLAFFSRFATDTHNQSRYTRWFHALVVFCVIGELLWIGGAAFFGTTSHFNEDTQLMALLYPLMGVFAVTLTSASLVLGLAILRAHTTGLPLAIGASLIATFIATCVTAGYMSQTGSHFVGGTSTELLPIMGWARDLGDLRVSHFFALHIMHFAPALALAAFVIGFKSRMAMLAPTLLTGALALITFRQALHGQPFLPWLT